MFRWIFPAIALAMLSIPLHAQTTLPTTDLPKATPFGYQVQRATNTGTGWWQTDKEGCWGWYRHNRLVGRWWQDLDTWQAWDGRRWGPETAPPWQQPAGLPGAQRTASGINFGLDQSKINQHGERFLIGGAEVDSQNFHADLHGNFRDDSKTPQTTVFDANPQRRAATVQQLQQRLGEQAKVSDYNPTDPNQQSIALAGWKLAENKGLQQTGQMIAVQAPPDQDAKGNPTGFGQVEMVHYGPLTADAVNAIARKVDGTYDPNASPSGGAGVAVNWGWLWTYLIWPLITALGGAGGAAAVMSKGPKADEPEQEQEGETPPRSSVEDLTRAIEQWQKDREARAAVAAAQAQEDAKLQQALLTLAGK